MKTFKNSELGAVRVCGTSGNPLFCVSDALVCMGCESKRPTQQGIVKKLPAGERQLVLMRTRGGCVTRMLFCTLAGIRQLAESSSLSTAPEFLRWVEQDVLPCVHANGTLVAGDPLIPTRPTELHAKALITADRILQPRAETEKELMARTVIMLSRLLQTNHIEITDDACV